MDWKLAFTNISDDIKGNKKIRKLLLTLLLSATLATPVFAQTIKVTYYNCCNTHTANGDIFDPNGLTGASKTLPFGTKVRITYHGKSVIIRINDRGPYNKDSSVKIDLTEGAARQIGCSGKCTVDMEIL